MGSFGTWKFLFVLSLLPKNQCGPCVTLVKICLFKHVVLSCLAQMSNEVKQKKSWLTPFTYAVFLSSPVALCLTTYIFTTNVTEELKIRVGLFSSRQCWAKLCCILQKTSYAKGSARMRLFGPACCSQMLFLTPSAFTPASSRQMGASHQGWTDTSFPHHARHQHLWCSLLHVQSQPQYLAREVSTILYENNS